MKMLNLVACVGFGVAAFVGAASGAPVFEDDFAGSAVDGAKWTSSGSVSVSGSNATVTTDGRIATIDTYSPTDGDYTVNLTGWGSAHNKFVAVGFSDSTGDNKITFTTNANSPTSMNVAMRSGGGTEQTYQIAMNSVFFQLDWTLTVNEDQVTFNHDIDGWMTPFDSDTIAPTGGGSWVIPTVDMSFVFHAGGLGSNGPLDKVAIDLVPEPASLVLLGLGSLMLVKRRELK